MAPTQNLPTIIQGGMGVAVSNWRLAQSVARRGMLGVVSGTGIDQVLARRMQVPEPKEYIKRAFAAFPCQVTVERAMKRFWNEEGKASDAPFRTPAMTRLDSPAEHHAFTALAAFTEIWLAKEGHNGPIGLNLLEKIALPNPAILLGAILANVDYLLMGAGIPWQIPQVLDDLSNWKKAHLQISVEGDQTNQGVTLEMDPEKLFPGLIPSALKRPAFLCIVSSHVVAQALLKRSTSSIEGFIVEAHIAGGHNAPPRGALRLNELGEPVYGERDEIDFEKFRSIEKPFWIAGGQGAHGALEHALEQGAVGIQVGTMFAFCRESGLQPTIRRAALETISQSTAKIYTDPLASPTGFPFKVVELSGSLSDSALYDDRKRVCDAGYLRKICKLPNGEIGYRCPGEPVEEYLRKGGEIEDTIGRKCLCNALLGNVGLPQIREHGKPEGFLLTAGDDFTSIASLFPDNLFDYSATDVIDLLIKSTP